MTTCDRARKRLAAVSLALVLLHPCLARAQADEQAAARALFLEGRALMKAEQYDAACPKLEAAAKLYKGSGVLLNLADCYEHIGRTASAWNEFGEAVSLAIAAGRRDDEAEARRRQAALEPHLAHLVVNVKDPAPRLTLSWDGRELLAAAWQTAIPVDPGEHALAAAAPAHTSWSRSIHVPDGTTVTVDVPSLDATPAVDSAASATAPVAPPRRYWTLRREVGVGVAASGIVVLAAAGATALVASSEYGRATGESGSARVHDSSTAVTEGDAATVLAGIGIAATALGAVVWLTAPSAPVQVALEPMRLRGTF